jgi:dTMP kinase
MKGIFITFEGPEGSGKTTQMRGLSTHLASKGLRVVCTREPGGTAIAARIRKLLLHGKDGLKPLAELLLYEADRAQHVQEKILPALRQGRVVLCDRFTDSTLAYQGFGRGLERKWVETLNAIATEGLKPHLTILLDIPVHHGLRRALQKKNKHDRLERAGLAFHRRVRAGFLALAKKEPRRFRIINAQQSIEQTQSMIRECVVAFLSSCRRKPASRMMTDWTPASARVTSLIS